MDNGDLLNRIHDLERIVAENEAQLLRLTRIVMNSTPPTEDDMKWACEQSALIANEPPALASKEVE